MARNEVFRDADYLSLPVPTGTLSGAPVRIGGLNGVAQTNEGSVDKARRVSYNPGYVGPDSASGNEDGYASVALKGAWRFPFAAGVGAVAIGDPIYITSANVLNATASGNNLYGYAISAKASGAGTVIVRIAN
jgi:predicted RecA/RadA family phage recombinase